MFEVQSENAPWLSESLLIERELFICEENTKRKDKYDHLFANIIHDIFVEVCSPFQNKHPAIFARIESHCKMSYPFHAYCEMDQRLGSTFYLCAGYTRR